MSKVNSLRKIISKLNDGEIPDSELDTVVKCLDKIADIVSDTGGGSSGGDDAPYELIETITVEADTNTIERTAEPDGTQYNFRKVLIKLTAKKYVDSGDAPSCYVYSNWAENATVAKLTMSKYNETIGTSLTEIKNGRVFSNYFGESSFDNDDNLLFQAAYYKSYYAGSGVYECDAITLLKFVNTVDNQLKNIPVGSTIEIYAVRK